MRAALRRTLDVYVRVLNALLAATVAIIVIPVSMQIFARFTELFPRYIWTEELSRFLLVWMVMIGAMVGVREATHFTVDLFGDLRGRTRAAMDLAVNICMLIFALVFIVYGWEFTDSACTGPPNWPNCRCGPSTSPGRSPG